MLALIIAVLDDIYSIIAVWLNDCGELCILDKLFIFLKCLVTNKEQNLIFVYFVCMLHIENYRLDTEYENQLIIKVTLVRV